MRTRKKQKKFIWKQRNAQNELQNDFAAILNISAGLSQNGQSVFA